MNNLMIDHHHHHTIYEFDINRYIRKLEIYTTDGRY